MYAAGEHVGASDGDGGAPRRGPRRGCHKTIASCTSSALTRPDQDRRGGGPLLARSRRSAGSFEAKTGKKVVLSFGSSGLLAKQIAEGAPFDLFAAANVSFADDAVKSGRCQADTKRLYARGRIVLWTRRGAPMAASLSDLTSDRFTKIAIANPEHAPYGKAAREALEHAGIWEQVKPKIVFGENVRQALQFAETGNADAAIVALSLAKVTDGEVTEVPEDAHAPLDQAMVVCGTGPRAAVAEDFAAFVGSPEGRAIMNKFGFVLPGEAVK
ncbi:MAG: molybdate ABC transporter substrate-binding protein [Polyangiaceae bacterium]